MRKVIIMTIIIVFSLLSFCFAISYNASVLINKTISICYNDSFQEFYDVSGTKVYPISYNGTTYLPIRAISSLIDIPINWDDDTKSIHLGTGETNHSCCKKISSFISQESEWKNAIVNEDVSIYYNGTLQRFKNERGEDIFPISYSGTTYLPIRSVSKLFNITVDWNGDKNQISLFKNNNTESISSIISFNSLDSIIVKNNQIKTVDSIYIYFNTLLDTIDYTLIKDDGEDAIISSYLYDDTIDSNKVSTSMLEIEYTREPGVSYTLKLKNPCFNGILLANDEFIKEFKVSGTKTKKYNHDVENIIFDNPSDYSQSFKIIGDLKKNEYLRLSIGDKGTDNYHSTSLEKSYYETKDLKKFLDDKEADVLLKINIEVTNFETKEASQIFSTTIHYNNGQFVK